MGDHGIDMDRQLESGFVLNEITHNVYKRPNGKSSQGKIVEC